MSNKIVIFWFRRDLRLHDNVGLYHALQSGLPVLPIFIFDTNILDALAERNDARVEFIHDTLTQIQQQLTAIGSTLHVLRGTPTECWQQLIATYTIGAVYTNHDYEPYAIARDAAIRDLLQQHAIPFHTYKDHVIFEKGEVLKSDGTPYTVFTPYSRQWLALLQSRCANPDDLRTSAYLQIAPSEALTSNFYKTPPLPLPSLEAIGFEPSSIEIPPAAISPERVRQYAQRRNFPSIEQGTTRLGIHFRFGTISLREKIRKALPLSDTFVKELIWRDFYAMILAHFPHVTTQPFKPAYGRIEWRNDEAEFARWCDGQTGYPIVDAGMRQLNATGYMHNRVRMITASFLTKHLLIDWRWGEAYFAQKLLDFDLSSNNGGWQWAAGSGTDAAPYFRIFNPALQAEKFDANHTYISRWVPEWHSPHYISPIVEHAAARARALAVYKAALEER